MQALFDIFKNDIACIESPQRYVNGINGIAELRSRVANEKIVSILMHCVTTDYTALALIFKFISYLTDEQVNMLYAQRSDQLRYYQRIKYIVSRLSIENIEHLVNSVENRRGEYAKILTVLLPRLVQLQRSDLIARLAFSPGTSFMFACDLPDMTLLMPKHNVNFGIFLTAYADQQQLRCRGNDVDSMIAVINDLISQMLPARLSENNKNQLVAEFCNIVLSGSRACLILIAATELPLLFNYLKDINVDVVTQLAQLNHHKGRYAMVGLIENNQERVIDYVSAYCYAVTDIASLMQLKASLENFYRKSRPLTSTFFTESQIPKAILNVILAAEKSELRVRMRK